MTLMGALEFMRERQALAGNRLNLGSWWGFQEVVWKRPVSKLKEIRFSFSLQKKAYLYFLFNRDRDGSHAFRLSANEIFPSMFVELDQSGKFLKKEPLQTGIRPYRWYSVRIIFDDETVTMYVDNLLLTHLNVRMKSLQALGFRAGEENASIDDFAMVKSGNEGRPTRFTDDFSPRLAFMSKLRLAAAVLAVIVFLGLVFQPIMGGQIVLHWLMVSLIVSSTLGIYYLADFYLVSHQYLYSSPAVFHPQRGQTVEHLHWIESGRRKLFVFLAEKVFREKMYLSAFVPNLDPFIVNSLLKPVTHEYLPSRDAQIFEPNSSFKLREPENLSTVTPNKQTPKHQRVVFLGTSQTWGCGAWNTSTTFVGIFHQYANTYNTLVKTETFNFSIAGSNSSELLEHYKKWGEYIQADYLIVNLSSNDSSGEILYKNLHELLRINRRIGTKVIFILEANSLEKNVYITSKHQSMKRLALENEVPVFDLHHFINSSAVYDSGFLWWDLVHLDQHGHNVVATWLVENLKAERFIF
jgi:lysophospholipase L1-like esterase